MPQTMPVFSTPAILLKRIPHGDYDLILTFLTQAQGRLTVIAKNAQKSRKRFSGVLELFSLLNLVCTKSRGRGMPVLQEASLENPFADIRGHIKKTAYASYWAELLNLWLEEGKPQPRTYELFASCLNWLDAGEISEEAASIIFQMQFLSLSGLSPHLTACCRCGNRLENFRGERLIFELAKGGLVCQLCATAVSSRLSLSRGTVKQLLWVQNNPIKKIRRLRFSRPALSEGLEFLEKFVPYHLGKEPKSLRFLKGLR